MEEKLIRKVSPSQWTNFPVFLICIVLIALMIAATLIFALNPIIAWLSLIPGIVMFWYWLKTGSHKFEVTNERIIEHMGVFSKKSDEVELYRVRDITHERPFHLRLVGLSNITVLSSDRSQPELLIPAITKGKQLKEDLRKAVEAMREKKRVRDVDLGGGGEAFEDSFG